MFGIHKLTPLVNFLNLFRTYFKHINKKKTLTDRLGYQPNEQTSNFSSDMLALISVLRLMQSGGCFSRRLIFLSTSSQWENSIMKQNHDEYVGQLSLFSTKIVYYLNKKKQWLQNFASVKLGTMALWRQKLNVEVNSEGCYTA